MGEFRDLIYTRRSHGGSSREDRPAGQEKRETGGSAAAGSVVVLQVGGTWTWW